MSENYKNCLFSRTVLTVFTFPQLTVSSNLTAGGYFTRITKKNVPVLYTPCFITLTFLIIKFGYRMSYRAENLNISYPTTVSRTYLGQILKNLPLSRNTKTINLLGTILSHFSKTKLRFLLLSSALSFQLYSNYDFYFCLLHCHYSCIAGDRTSHLIKFTGERCGRGGRVLIFNTLPGSLSSIVWRIPSWRVLKKR